MDQTDCPPDLRTHIHTHTGQLKHTLSTWSGERSVCLILLDKEANRKFHSESLCVCVRARLRRVVALGRFRFGLLSLPLRDSK